MTAILVESPVNFYIRDNKYSVEANDYNKEYDGILDQISAIGKGWAD